MSTVGAEPEQYQAMPELAHNSILCGIAASNQYTKVSVRFPRYVVMNKITQEAATIRAVDNLAFNLQRGFETVRRVTFLTRGEKDGVTNLMKEEEQELAHAMLGKPGPDGTIAPRRYSVHLLLRSSPRNCLPAINALAHLAHHEGKKAEGLAPAATHARFAILANIDAEDFLEKRMRAFQDTPVPANIETGSILLVATTPLRTKTGELKIRSRCTELSQAPSKTSQDFVCEIVQSLSGFASADAIDDFGPFPSPPGSVYHERPVCKESAFVDSVVDTGEMFKEMLVAPINKRFASYCATGEFEGQFEFDFVYTRMIPKRLDHNRGFLPPDHPECTVGLLCYAAGRAEQVDAWTRQQKQEANGHWPFGLPPAGATAHEQDMALHLLFYEARRVDVAAYLSCYGLGNAKPGNRLCPCQTQQENCHMWRLFPHLESLDHTLGQRYFTLPIGRVCGEQTVRIFPKYEGLISYNECLPSRYHEAITKLSKYFDRKAVDFSEIMKCSPSVSGRLSVPPQAEERYFVHLGIGLDSPATRLGDVIAAAQTLPHPPDALLRMLLAAVDRLGPDASIDDAFEAARKALVKRPETNLEQEEQANSSEPIPATVVSMMMEASGVAPSEATESAESAESVETINTVEPLRAFMDSTLRKESDVCCDIHKRSPVIKVFAKALGKRKNDFDEGNLASALEVEELTRETSESEVESRLTKVARRLISDNEDDDEMLLAFRNGTRALTIFRVDGEETKQVDAATLDAEPDSVVVICDHNTKFLSYLEKNTLT